MSEEIQNVRCPSCGTENTFDGSVQSKLFCQECGKDLTKYVIVENNNQTIPPTNHEQTTLCPTCGKTIISDSKFCPFCGVNFEPENTSTITTFPNKDITNEIACPNCGNIVEDGSAYCNKCGTKLEIEPPKCPNCGQEYTVGEDLYCKKCGTKLSVENNIKQIKEKFCPNCGNSYKDELFCGVCGQKLQDNEAELRQSAAGQAVTKIEINANTQNSQYDNQYELRKCRYCGSSISKYSEKCPHCGEWQKVSHFGCGTFMMIISGIIAILVLAGWSSVNLPIIGSIGGGLLFFIILFYFLPSLIADLRGHESKTLIFVVNLLFGWTFVGWVITLIMSFTGRSR